MGGILTNKLEHHDLRSALDVIVHNIAEARNEKWTGSNPIRIIIDIDVPNYISDYLSKIGYNLDYYVIKSSSGKCGRWTCVAYTIIMEKKVCLDYSHKISPRWGVYPGLFFNQECSKLYLLLEQGVANRTKKELSDNRLLIQSKINCRSFKTDTDQVILGIDPGEYAKGAIFYKEYDTNVLPTNEELLDDIKEMMVVYDEYIKLLYKPRTVNPKYSIPDE